MTFVTWADERAVPPADREIAEKTAREILNFLTAIDWSQSTPSWREKRISEFVERAIESAVAQVERELKKRDKCSFIGPMRDCPTHGESLKLVEVEKALSGLLAVTEKRGDAAKFLAVGKAEAALASLRGLKD